MSELSLAGLGDACQLVVQVGGKEIEMGSNRIHVGLLSQKSHFDWFRTLLQHVLLLYSWHLVNVLP